MPQDPRQLYSLFDQSRGDPELQDEILNDIVAAQDNAEVEHMQQVLAAQQRLVDAEAARDGTQAQMDALSSLGGARTGLPGASTGMSVPDARSQWRAQLEDQRLAVSHNRFLKENKVSGMDSPLEPIPPPMVAAVHGIAARVHEMGTKLDKLCEDANCPRVIERGEDGSPVSINGKRITYGLDGLIERLG